MKNVKKVILTVLAVALIVTLSVTATLAWLQDTTEPVVNTFTEGKVDIDLFEHQYDSTNNSLTNTEIRGDATVAGDEGNSYKMIPGAVLPKDPTVAVLAGSEDCWLFVKVEKTDNVDTFLDYNIAGGWTALDGVDGVYYREVSATTDEDGDGDFVVEAFPVLRDNKVTVKSGVNMDNMKGLSANNYPKLTFTAYAIQSANLPDTDNDGTTVDEAWADLNS